MWVKGGQVLTVSSRALVDACERLGLDVDALLASVDLDRETLADPDARIPTAQVGLLWQRAYEMSKDPNLALHAVEALEFGAYKVIDFVAGHAATVGQAFEKVSEYFPLINTTIRLPITQEGAEVSFGLAPVSPDVAISRPYAEYTFGACFLRVRTAAGHFDALRIELTHPAPDDISEHERIFECPVHFESDRLRLVFSREVWDQPAAHPNPELFEVLNEHARLLLERLSVSGGFVADVRKAILAHLRGGTPTLESVAKDMGMSGRTLQRRLREEAASFHDLLDELREGMAQKYLIDRDISISEVAYLLGFSEQSAFNRAFKRWTGQTPLQYRKAHHPRVGTVETP